MDWRLDIGVEPRDRLVRAGIKRANHCVGWCMEIGDSRGLAHELRVHYQPEVLAADKLRMLFQDGQHHIARDAWEDRAAKADHMVSIRPPQTLAYIVGDSLDIIQHRASIGVARRANADQ